MWWPGNQGCCCSLFLILGCHSCPMPRTHSPGWQMHSAGLASQCTFGHCVLLLAHVDGDVSSPRERARDEPQAIPFSLWRFRRKAGTSGNVAQLVLILFLDGRKHQQLWAKPMVKHSLLSHYSFARSDPMFASLQWRLLTSHIQSQSLALVVGVLPEGRHPKDKDLSHNWGFHCHYPVLKSCFQSSWNEFLQFQFILRKFRLQGNVSLQWPNESRGREEN